MCSLLRALFPVPGSVGTPQQPPRPPTINTGAVNHSEGQLPRSRPWVPLRATARLVTCESLALLPLSCHVERSTCFRPRFLPQLGPDPRVSTRTVCTTHCFQPGPDTNPQPGSMRLFVKCVLCKIYSPRIFETYLISINPVYPEGMVY